MEEESKRENAIASQIALSIKEGKWLSVRYDSHKEKRNTSFWCFVNDIDPKEKKLSVSCFNTNKGTDTIEVTLSFSRILEARIINFTIGAYNQALVDKINGDLEGFAWLKFENFSNNILSYLERCCEMDEDPSIKDYAMIEGIDSEVLAKNGEFILNDEQINGLVRYVIKTDLSDYERKRSELALSRLSIDEDGKKYIVAYENVYFSPKEKKMKLIGKMKINSSFLIDGQRHSLSTYTELNSMEFLENLNTDFLAMSARLRESLRPGESIDSRPDFYCLQRDMQLNLPSLFAKIENRYKENNLEAPLKAFFGNSSLENNGRTLPSLVFFDDKVNIDQALLVYRALKNKVTYVQGPPGTGKTQTIFNTILSSLFAKKTVLISTNNNRPLDGIVEKFSFSYKNKHIEMPFLRLGNMGKTAEAALKIKKIHDSLNEEALSVEELEKLRKRVLSKNKEAVLSLTNYQKRSAALDNLNFLNKAEDLGARNSIVKKQKPLLEKEISSLKKEDEKEIISHFVSLEHDEEALKYLYYSSLSRFKKLCGKNYEELIRIAGIEEESKRAIEFNSYLASNKNLALLADVFPLIFDTNLSSYRLGDGDYAFDLLIMDEAGQADLAHSLIPLSRAKSLLLVGDEDQLLPVIELDPSVNEALKKEFEISDTYDYLSNSILSSMKAADKVTDCILLRNHYRCGKKIIDFNNQYFYENKLIVNPSLSDGELLFFDCENTIRTPLRNQNYSEAYKIVQYCKNNDITDCAIITPFVNQAKLINDLLIKNGISEVKAATIHSVQGAEKNTIIISDGVSSFTSKNTIKWLNKHGEIANVAVSRAKKKLVVFGNKEKLKSVKSGDSVWNELIKYCESNGNIEVVAPECENLSIGKSNGSLNEDEFYETIGQIVSTMDKYVLVRNVALKSLFEEYEDSSSEFDSVIYKKQLFKKDLPLYAFEFDGGEHYRDINRIKADKRKMEVCQKHGVRLLKLPNYLSKDYEFLKKLIEGYEKADDAEQLSLF